MAEKVITNEIIEINDDSIILEKAGKITFVEFEKIKAGIEEYVKNFEISAINNGDDYKKMKADRITLNKNSKKINDLRIQIKNQILTPYVNLEDQIKEIDKHFVSTSEKINDELLDYETAEKELKKKELNKVFISLNEEYQVDFIKFEDILDKTWLNKSTTIKKSTKVMNELLEKFSNDLKIIELDEYGARIKTRYLDNGYDLAESKRAVLAEIAQETIEQAKIDSQMKQQELVIDEQVLEKAKVVEKKPEKQRVVKNESLIVEFKLKGSKEELIKVVKYIKECDVEIIK